MSELERLEDETSNTTPVAAREATAEIALPVLATTLCLVVIYAVYVWGAYRGKRP